MPLLEMARACGSASSVRPSPSSSTVSAQCADSVARAKRRADESSRLSPARDRHSSSSPRWAAIRASWTRWYSDEVVLAYLSCDPEAFAHVRRRRGPAAFPQLGAAHPGKDLRQDDKQAGSAGPNYRLVVDAVKGPIVPKEERGPPGEQERHGLLGRRVVIKLRRQAQGQAKCRRGSGEVALDSGRRARTEGQQAYGGSG